MEEDQAASEPAAKFDQSSKSDLKFERVVRDQLCALLHLLVRDKKIFRIYVFMAVLYIRKLDFFNIVAFLNDSEFFWGSHKVE